VDIVAGLAGRTVFIVGSGKNAGKTTFLNYALSRLRPLGTPGFLSIGVDGEERDLVFDSPKPRIRAEAGDLLVTSDRLLRSSELDWETLEVFPGSTVLGRQTLARVVRGGTVELCGPEHNAQLGPCLAALRGRGARTILVDGAVDRVTQVSSLPGAGFVAVMRADPSRLEAARDAMRLLHSLALVPLADGRPGPGTVVVCGALTRGRLAALPPSARSVVIEDFTKVFLTWREWKAASARLELRFARRLDLLFFSVVLDGVSREEFAAGLEADILARTLYNPYEAACA
jgi:hypothetical protein